MTPVDWIALAIVVLAAFAGMQRGLILSAFSLAGLALGAYVGSRVAPHLLSGGASSNWRGVAGLVGAVLGAGILQVVAVVAGSYVRGGLRITPLRVVDSTGGLLLGVVTGLGIVWVCAAVVLQAPQPISFRHDVRRSWIVRQLDAALPSRWLTPIRQAVDPYPFIFGPPAPTLPPSVGVLRNRHIRGSLSRVVKVLGTACGSGIEGSGWFARGDLVVTAAHVVAGEREHVRPDPRRSDLPSGDRRRLRRAQRHRRPPHLGRDRSPAATRGPAGRSVGRDRGLSARREPHRRRGAGRAHGERVHPGRARAPPRRARHHRFGRTRSSMATPAGR